MVTLVINEIGTADTTRTEHPSAEAAFDAMLRIWKPEYIRTRDNLSGTVGSMTGKVFQASKVWRIEASR